MQITITENTIRRMVGETVKKVVNEMNHMLYGNDWYFDEPDYSTITVGVTAYYYNEETDEEKTEEFSVEVEVPGSYYEDADEDGRYAAFEPDSNIDYHELVRQTGEIPEELEGGFTLQDMDIEQY